MSDYHLIGSYTRYSSMPTPVCPSTRQAHEHELTPTGWTARVETVLEYFEIPYTSQMLTFDEVPLTSKPLTLRATLTTTRSKPTPPVASSQCSTPPRCP